LLERVEAEPTVGAEDDEFAVYLEPAAGMCCIAWLERRGHVHGVAELLPPRPEF
jgi:hypothetical protein